MLCPYVLFHMLPAVCWLSQQALCLGNGSCSFFPAMLILRHAVNGMMALSILVP